jgi:hypothetical protein
MIEKLAGPGTFVLPMPVGPHGSDSDAPYHS